MDKRVIYYNDMIKPRWNRAGYIGCRLYKFKIGFLTNGKGNRKVPGFMMCLC
jgi:hypothetical protein